MSCVLENSFYFMRLSRLFFLGWFRGGGFILIDFFFVGSCMIKMRLEVESEVIKVINSYLVIIG